jgi:hypothetical protein
MYREVRVKYTLLKSRFSPLGSTLCTGSELESDWAVENVPSLVRWYFTSFVFLLFDSLEWIHKLLIHALHVITKYTLVIFMMNLKVEKRISIFKETEWFRTPTCLQYLLSLLNVKHTRGDENSFSSRFSYIKTWFQKPVANETLIKLSK